MKKVPSDSLQNFTGKKGKAPAFQFSRGMQGGAFCKRHPPCKAKDCFFLFVRPLSPCSFPFRRTPVLLVPTASPHAVQQYFHRISRGKRRLFQCIKHSKRLSYGQISHFPTVSTAPITITTPTIPYSYSLFFSLPPAEARGVKVRFF